MRYINFSGANNGSSTHAEIRPLAGLRVVFSGIEIAGPFAGKCSQNGARKLSGSKTSPGPHHSRSTELSATFPPQPARAVLNIFKDEGREAFLKLMETTVSSSKPVKAQPLPAVALLMKPVATQPETGYRSPVRFWSVCTEEYTNLPAYNTIAQAFSGS